MLNVAVIGDPDSGKTTFLGLLYATLVRSGSDRADELRFHVSYESLDEISALFQQLMSGGFPDAATKEGVHGLSVEIGFRQARRASFLHRGASARTAESGTTVRFALPGSLDEHTPGLFRGSTFGTGRWRDALDADAICILVDGARLVPAAAEAELRRLEAYDRHVESLFIAIQRWRSRGGRPTLHPLFVISKFDAVKPQVLQAASLDRDPPSVAKTGPRAAYARPLLAANLPKTLAAIETGSGPKLRFTKPAYFFSWVRTEAKGPDATVRIRLRQIDGGGWEPDYPREEYLALLDALGEIAAAEKA